MAGLLTCSALHWPSLVVAKWQSVMKSFSKSRLKFCRDSIFLNISYVSHTKY
jgi:hypothetical protein